MANFQKRREFTDSLLGVIESRVEPSDIGMQPQRPLRASHPTPCPYTIHPSVLDDCLRSCFLFHWENRCDRRTSTSHHTCTRVPVFSPWVIEGHSVLLPKGSPITGALELIPDCIQKDLAPVVFPSISLHHWLCSFCWIFLISTYNFYDPLQMKNKNNETKNLSRSCIPF